MQNIKTPSPIKAPQEAASPEYPASDVVSLPKRLDNKAAAAYIGIAPSSLKHSRHTGLLCGVPTPAYRKLGRRVVYDLATLHAYSGEVEHLFRANVNT